jgi:hypothetical protein
VDDLDEIIKTLYEAGYTDDRFYIHWYWQTPSLPADILCP